MKGLSSLGISSLNFLNHEHKQRFLSMICKDTTSEHDTERLTLFYILAGNDDIRRKPIDAFYDFENHVIRRSGTKKYYLCSSGMALLKLAFNLYNPRLKSDTYETFYNLGKENFNLAMNALRLRFKK